jgi:hypothetical protein
VHLELEWVYDNWRLEQAAVGVADQDSEGVKSNEHLLNSETRIPTLKLIAPPPEDIAVLLDLARRGNIRGIDEQAARLEHLDAQFVPFASELRQLAQNFQIKQIREFLETLHFGS